MILLCSALLLAFTPGEHFRQCQQLAPTATTPTSDEAYSTAYAALEQRTEAPPRPTLPMAVHVRHLLKETLHQDVPLDQIHLLPDGFGRGLSQNPIYKITDAEQRPQTIVKVFRAPSGEFSKEYFVLTQLNTHAFSTLRIPTLLGVDVQEIDGHKTFFLAMTYLEGTTLYNLFQELFSHTPNALQTLQQAYAALGVSIAELHSAATTEPLSLHPLYLDTIEGLSERTFAAALQHGADPKAITAAKERFFSQFAALSQQPLIRGYMHGDANTGNYIYNPTTNTIGMVDFTEAVSSFGQDDTPIGVPFYHLAQIENQLLLMDSCGLTPEEHALLRTTFLTAYAAQGQPLPSPEEWRFFRTVDHLRFMYWYLTHRDHLDAKTRETVDPIYATRLSDLVFTQNN